LKKLLDRLNTVVEEILHTSMGWTVPSVNVTGAKPGNGTGWITDALNTTPRTVCGRHWVALHEKLDGEIELAKPAPGRTVTLQTGLLFIFLKRIPEKLYAVTGF